MKKFCLLVILCICCRIGYGQSFSATLSGNPVSTTGWTFANGTSFVNDSSFELTQPIGNQAGYIYYSTPENLTTCAQFTVDFDFQIIPSIGLVADGIAFWYISNPPTGFTLGGGIGLPQYPNGLILILDTYNNDALANNPLETLLGYNNSGNTIMGYTEGSSIGVLGSVVTNQSFIDDGNWHHCKLTYNGGSINVYFNNSATPSITGNYTLNQTGYFGFSASTGAAYSTQSIKDVVITGTGASPTPTSPSPVVYCQYATADSLMATGNDLIWYNTPGGTPLPGSPTPNTTVPDTTYYYVAQAGACPSPLDTIQVIVHPQPAAPQITGDTTYCNGATFVPFNVSGDSILWYPTSTSTAGTTVAPVVNTLIPDTTTYYAGQRINGCASAKDSITVTVYPVTPEPSIAGGPLTYCYGAPFIPFTATGQDVLWYDASGNGSPIPPVVNTFSSGTYAYNVTQTINGCPSADTAVFVTVYPQTPPPQVTDTSYCAGDTFVPLNIQGSNVLWYTTDSGGTGTTSAPTVNTSIPGVYTFYATQTLNGCESDRAAVTVTVYQGVHTAFTYTLHYGCKDDTVVFNNATTGATLYAWYFGDGHSDTSANPTHVYASQGTYIVSLYATNAKCSDSTQIDTITINHPIQPAFTLSADTICQGQSITFYNNSIGTQPVYFWDFGDGFGSITDSPTHTFTLAGVYQVKLEENDFVPCFDTAVATVYVDSISAINFSVSDSVLCAGKQIIFTGDYSSIGNIGNSWSFGDGSSQMDGNPMYHSYDNAGTMQVTLTALYRKCPDTSITKMVTINPYPTINLGPDTSICPNGQPIALNDLVNAGNPQAHWLWNTGDTTSGILIASPAVYYSTVTINGCSTSDSVWVKNDCYINLPNAFTPNGDGVNDYFFPRNLLTSGAIQFSMSVYDRWGEQVFTTTSTDGRGWDGKFNNEEQPQGVYIYIIDITFKDGKQEHHQGNISLLR